jgi:hypothetical protein
MKKKAGRGNQIDNKRKPKKRAGNNINKRMDRNLRFLFIKALSRYFPLLLDESMTCPDPRHPAMCATVSLLFF